MQEVRGSPQGLAWSPTKWTTWRAKKVQILIKCQTWSSMHIYPPEFVQASVAGQGLGLGIHISSNQLLFLNHLCQTLSSLKARHLVVYVLIIIGESHTALWLKEPCTDNAIKRMQFSNPQIWVWILGQLLPQSTNFGNVFSETECWFPYWICNN